MFKRIVTIITVISIFTLLPNGIVLRAGAFSPFRSPFWSAKEKPPPCAPCAAAQATSALDSIDRLATIGRRTQVSTLTPVQRSIFDGTPVNLVSTATGHLSFAITDLQLPGQMPIMFQRTYASDRTEDTGLGAGWSFVFDDRITLSGEAATLSTGTGSVTAFRRDGPSQHFVLKTNEPTSHQSFDVEDSSTIVEASVGQRRIYKKIGSIYRLRQIADADGNAITISFDARQNISQVTDGGSRAITFEWSEGKDSRLLAVTDSAGRRVAFKQDGQRLRTVMDAAGGRWSYDYKDGRLTHASDPLDRVMLYARYDKAGRTVEAGDAAGTNIYEYFFASGAARRTVITDAIGAKTVFDHTESGALAAISDEEGQALLRLEYNAANRLTRMANTLGTDATFAYDSQNRLIRQSQSDGTFQASVYDEHGQIASIATEAGRTDYTHDERGNVISAKSADPAGSYRVVRDVRGQPTNIKSEAGTEVSFQYDESGNTTGYSFDNSGRFEINYDAAGRVKSRQLPSGAIYRYEYDERGLVTKQSAGRGRSITFERDPSGAITGVAAANGDWIRAIRDPAGRIVSLKTSSGKSRKFAYDARGALTDYVDARGRRKQFVYDRRGRLRSVADDEGRQIIIERDEKGRPQRISSFLEEPERGFNQRNGKFLALKQNFRVAQSLAEKYGRSLSHATSKPEDITLICFFGTDEFISSELIFSIDSGFTCYDPYGGFGSGDSSTGGTGGFGYFDPFFGLEPVAGETCEQCKERQKQICSKQKDACNSRVIQGGFWSGIGCAGVGVITGGTGLLLCVGLLFGGVGSGGVACTQDYDACVLKIIDNCPQCR